MIIEMTVEQMKEIVENYRCIAEDITFEFDKQGLTITAVDASHVCMLSSNYSNFIQYEVEEDTKLGFELNTLKQLLVGSKKTNVVMEWDGQGPVSFVINGMTRKVAPLTDNPYPLKLPDIDYSVELTLNTIWFENAMKHASDVADLVRLEVICKKMAYKAADYQLKVSAKDGNNNALEMFHDIEGVDNYPHQTYSLTYLKPMSKRIRMSLGKGDNNTLTLSFGTGRPTQIDFSSAFGDYNYFLAPRMEPDY